MFGLKLEYQSLLTALVAGLLSEHPGELWLIPHTFAPPGDVESDNEASEKLCDGLSPELRSRVRILAAEYDQHELKWIIGQCTFFVGSRMHSCIAALSQALPCVGVAYSAKFSGVFDSVGMIDWVVDGRAAGNDEAMRRILELFRRRNEMREALRRRADQAHGYLQQVFERLCARVPPNKPT